MMRLCNCLVCNKEFYLAYFNHYMHKRAVCSEECDKIYLEDKRIKKNQKQREQTRKRRELLLKANGGEKNEQNA